jgi:hypothetical protein
MNDNVDLYRQMLWDAQKVEDKKLARLVQKRLSPHLHTGRENCNKIIPFPAPPVFCTEAEPADFWKEQQFWTGLMQLFIVLGIAGAWFFMPFIKIIVSNM